MRGFDAGEQLLARRIGKTIGRRCCVEWALYQLAGMRWRACVGPNPRRNGVTGGRRRARFGAQAQRRGLVSQRSDEKWRRPDSQARSKARPRLDVSASSASEKTALRKALAGAKTPW
jgi:hypothetical protein